MDSRNLLFEALNLAQQLTVVQEPLHARFHRTQIERLLQVLNGAQRAAAALVFR